MAQINKSNSSTSFLTVSFQKVIALVIAISYIGGLWVNVQHELEGAHEVNEMPPILHWLRDSTLAVVFIFFGVMMAISFLRSLIQRSDGRLSPLARQSLTVLILGIFTGIAFALGIPVHGFLFGVHLEMGVELITDMLTDGSLVGLVNMAISALMIFLLGGLE